MKTKKTQYTEINKEKYFSILKRHGWWLLLLIIGISSLTTANNLLSGLRSAEDDVKKRQLGENLLKLFNYFPNTGQDSISFEDVFFANSETLMTYLQQIKPAMDINREQQERIRSLYPFLKLVPMTIIDSLRDFKNEREAVLYYRHFDYTALATADSLTLFPTFYKCIDKSNILQFKNFQVFSYFCESGELPYKRQRLHYQYRSMDGIFYCDKYLIQ
jgi:hypothetical protein